MATIDIKSTITEDGMIIMKVSPEQFNEIQYAVTQLVKRREISRKIMASKRSVEGKEKQSKRLKTTIKILSPDE